MLRRYAIYLIWKRKWMKYIRIGTRASKLAMIQTHWVVEQLRQHWPDLDIAIEQISTRGDHITDRPLTQIGSDGVFVIEIERALAEGRIDLAVHSLKDLPTAQPEGLCVLPVGNREDARDVLIWNDSLLIHDHPSMLDDHQSPEASKVSLNHSVSSRPTQDTYPADRGRLNNRPENGHPENACPGILVPHGLPGNLRIGTCSLRRTAQVRTLLPNIEILPLRGNVDTRLRKLDAGDYHAIVLAAAGLHRLGTDERLSGRMTYLPIELMMPAPGQGALAVEMRNEPEIRTLLAPLEDRGTAATTSAERMFMRRLGAGCYLPVAAYGEVREQSLVLQGLVISLDGQQQVRVRSSIDWTSHSKLEEAEQLGVRLAEQALAAGANEIINTIDTVRLQERQNVQ